MIGVEFDIPQKPIREKLVYEQHCFTGCASTNILRLLPPLCFSKENVDEFIGKLKNVLDEI
jgi:acetylornithine aminotransferase